MSEGQAVERREPNWGMIILIGILAVLAAIFLMAAWRFFIIDAVPASGQGEASSVWEEQSPQDGHVVVSDPNTLAMSPWLADNFDVSQTGYAEGTRFSDMRLHDGDVVSFHLVDNHRDLPQEIFPDVACFGTVFVYKGSIHGDYPLPSDGNVVIWHNPDRDLIPAISTWDQWREDSNPGWMCGFPTNMDELLAMANN